MRLVIIYALLLLGLISPAEAFSGEIKSYKAETTILVTSNDLDLVRSQAFRLLKKRLLFMAIEDVVDRELHREHSERLYNKGKLRPVDYLSSLGILEESTDGSRFSMTLEGKIYMDLLSEALREMDLVLKKDPWVSVALLCESGVQIPLEDFKSRLNLFHIKISRFQYIDLEKARSEAEYGKFAEALFERFPANIVIFLVEAVPGTEPESVRKLKLSIFKKAGFRKLGDFALNFNPLKRSEDFQNNLNALFPDFLKLFSASSLKRSEYYQGSESVFHFEVKGIDSPFLRSVFEDKILDANPHVRYFQKTQFASDLIGYKIRSDYDVFAFIKDLNENNSYFDFNVQNDDYNVLAAEAVFKLPEKATELKKVRLDKRLSELVRKALPEEDELSDEDRERSDGLFLAEREPNNSNRTFNRLPVAATIVGKLHSRGDNDVYQLGGDVEASEITIELIQVDKTSFSPQLCLYDDNFSLLKSYDMKRGLNTITHSFQEGESSSLYLRILDKVGFIQGETGGYKYFYYLLKYY